MRSSITTILMLFVLLMAQGCQKFIFDPDPSAGKGESSTLQIGIVTRAPSTKAEASDGTLGEAEYAIKTLRIFAFETDGKLDMTDYKEYSSAVTTSVVHEIEVKKAAQKLLYVIVNEPKGVFNNLAEFDTPGDLKDIEFTIAAAMNGGKNGDYEFGSDKFLIPMTAVQTIDATGSKNVTINVDRAVARVDFMLDKSEAFDNIVKLTDETTFKVNGVVVKSKLMKGESLPTYTSADVIEPFATIASNIELLTETADNSSAKRVLSFYIAERTYDKSDSDTKITIDVDRLLVDDKLININNTIVLGELTGDRTLTEIKRNYIYKIYATYIGVQQELVADQFSIVDWNYEVYDTEIEGVMMAVENTLAMDWLRNGNSFKGRNTSFGSNKPIEVYLPVVTGKDDKGFVTYDFVKYDFNFEAGSAYDLRTLPLENSLISELDWVTDAWIVFTSDKTGYVSFSYKPTYTTYDLQSYPIRFKSDNVVKQLKVIYDNGYIPVENLPDHWKLRAPGGVVFAKRGNLKHPRDVEEVFPRDEDGYYRGEQSLTAAQAQNYCKQLGAAWYMPSKEDLAAMLMGVKELGTSYRFQDTGSQAGAATAALYWTDTKSETTDNYYWCGNFIYNPDKLTSFDEAANWIEERSGNETNYIRCMLDLK